MYMNQPLKPCPFCGSNFIYINHDTNSDYKNTYSWNIFCRDCGQADVFVQDTECDEPMEKCIEIWNTRPLEKELENYISHAVEKCYDASEYFCLLCEHESGELKEHCEPCSFKLKSRLFKLRK